MIRKRAKEKSSQPLPVETQRALDAIATKASFRRNDYIFQANSSNRTVYLLLDGQLKVLRLSDKGHESIQWFCFPGEFFGLSEHTSCHDSGLYAQAVSNVQLLMIAKSEFYDLLQQTPSLSLLIIEQLSHRVRSLGDMLMHATRGNARDRLINLLQRLGEAYGEPGGRGTFIPVYLTHQDIADMIGVCRQTVSSEMAVLKKQGLISSNRRGFVVHDLSRFRHFPDPTAPIIPSTINCNYQ